MQNHTLHVLQTPAVGNRCGPGKRCASNFYHALTALMKTKGLPRPSSSPSCLSRVIYTPTCRACRHTCMLPACLPAEGGGAGQRACVLLPGACDPHTRPAPVRGCGAGGRGYHGRCQRTEEGHQGPGAVMRLCFGLCLRGSGRGRWAWGPCIQRIPCPHP